MKVVILAGGKGKRLEPYTTLLPKPLMPVGEYPILEIILRQLKYYGFKEVILAVGHLAELIQAYFGSGEKLGIKIEYAFEPYPLGTVGPLRLIEKRLDDSPFLVMNGDILTDLDFKEFMDFHISAGGVLTVGVKKRRVDIDFGVAELSGNVIVNYREKPTFDFWVSMGVYIFEPTILEYIPEGQRYDFPDLVRKLIENGEKISAYLYNGFWLDIGREEDMKRAQYEFESRKDSLLK